MRKVSFTESLQVIRQGSLNWFSGRPVVVSFEVTDSCNCFCRHCDHGGPRDDSRRLQPADFREYMRVLQPCVVQVSGGEPLLRDDLTEIIHAIKQRNIPPDLNSIAGSGAMDLGGGDWDTDNKEKGKSEPPKSPK